MAINLEEKEGERLRELIDYEILDTPEEQEFDDVVKMASQICDASISLITFVDECRQWFKAKVGIEIRETSKDIAFCAHTIHFENGMIVEDLLQDERFVNHPFVVAEPHLRFYAGVPLVSPAGVMVGTLCVLDQLPKKLSDEQLFALETLARHVVQILELKKKNKGLQKVMQEYEALRERTKKQQLALTRAQNAAKIGIYEWLPKPDIFTVSAGFCSLFGMKDCRELSREDFQQFIHPDDRKGFLKYFKKVIRTGKRFDYEFNCIRQKPRRKMFIRSTGELVRDENGKLERIVGIMQNITNKRNYENKLERQNAELKKLNQELDNFVYKVSHDLRAPISSMSGLVDIIVHHEHDLDRIRELLMLIKKSLEKQDKFIKDILDFSRNSRLSIEPDEVGFQELLTEAIAQFVHEGQSVEGQNSQARYFLHVEQKETFTTDKSRLEIILNNIISNAFKYVKPKGDLGKVSIHAVIEKGKAEIVVEDNGIGIEEEHLSRVFEMFYRATDNQPGSGLGLYIVREAVARLNGEVNLQSKSGQGTRVLVRLPNLLYDEESHS